MEEQNHYNDLHDECSRTVKAIMEAGLADGGYPQMLSLILKLRQSLDHPWLAKYEASSSVWKFLISSPVSGGKCGLCSANITCLLAASSLCNHVLMAVDEDKN